MTIELKEEEKYFNSKSQILAVDGQPAVMIASTDGIGETQLFHEFEWSTNLLFPEAVSLFKSAYYLTDARYNLEDQRFPFPKIYAGYVNLGDSLHLNGRCQEVPVQAFFSKPKKFVRREDVTINLATPFYQITFAVSPDKLNLETDCALRPGETGLLEGVKMAQMQVYANIPDIAAKIIKHTLQQPVQQSELEGIMAGLLSGYKIPEQIKENEKIKKNFL